MPCSSVTGSGVEIFSVYYTINETVFRVPYFKVTTARFDIFQILTCVKEKRHGNDTIRIESGCSQHIGPKMHHLMLSYNLKNMACQC